MTLDIFFQHFDHFAEAPNAVAKMRELILFLATSGGLTSSDSIDDSPENLVEEISVVQNKQFNNRERSEVSRLSASKKKESNRFSIPLGRIAKVVSGQHLNPEQYSLIPEGVPYISGPAEFGITNPVPTKWTSVKRALAKEGDILLTVKGSGVGKLNYNDLPELAIGRQIMAIRPLGNIPSEYIWICMKRAESYFQQKKSGIAIPGIGRMDVLTVDIFLPPLTEQKRIVAKVDELMALCDKLEEQQRERDQLFPLLSQSAHARFVASPTPKNLEALFSESISVSPEVIRKTILSMAVSGELVRQKNEEESAEDLVVKITSYRSELVENKLIKKPKKLSSPKPFPHSIPQSWAWIQLGELALLIEYGTSQKADNNSLNVPVYRMGNIQSGILLDDRLKYVSSDIDDLPRLYLESGDILFNRTNSAELVGKAGIYKGLSHSRTFASYLIRVRTSQEHVISEYINYCFLAPYYRSSQIEPELTQQCGQANFNGTKLANSLFPLPPLAEQKRIVAKVDELMAVVDRLEKQQNQKNEVAALYAQTAVAEITGTEIKEQEKMKAPKAE